MAGSNIKTKGVDSTTSSTDSLEAAIALSNRYGSVVSVSGEVDVIISGGKVAYVSNGVSLMTRVTGMGCTASAVAGAFAAIQPDYFKAAVSAAAAMGVCGEFAHMKSQSPGTFQITFLDVLSEITPEQLGDYARIK